MCSDSSPARAAPPESPAASTAPVQRGWAVFDLDGTLTRHDTLAFFLLRCLRPRPWRLARLPLALPAALRFAVDRDRGALKGALLHALLGGLSREALRAPAARYALRVARAGIRREAREALGLHRNRGDRLILLSASTDLYVPQIAAALGFDACICSQVAWREDGRLDGHLATPNVRGEEKRHQLSALIERERPERVYAYGNSASDLPHLQLAQAAYLVNGPRRLREALPVGVQRVRWRG